MTYKKDGDTLELNCKTISDSSGGVLPGSGTKINTLGVTYLFTSNNKLNGNLMCQCSYFLSLSSLSGFQALYSRSSHE